MKIGTLTLHLPFNYGNALQMLSLHRYLREQGYDTEVISHWYFENRAEISELHIKTRSLSGKIRFAFDCLLCAGIFSQFMRESKITKWLSKIRWSKESGVTDELQVANLPYDVIVVGSDQIWNPKHETSKYFLLPDFPDSVRKIAYAASMGTDRLEDEKRAFFSENLKRFNAVSVRESSAVGIICRDLGGVATLVCDPVLLHSKEEWCDLLDFAMPRKTTKSLVAYFVTQEVNEQWRELVHLARTSGRIVHFYAFRWSQWLPSFNFHRPLSSVATAIRNIKKILMLYSAGVRVHYSASPSEFVRAIAYSEGVVTDSFHGMIVATIFGKKCNVVIGKDPERQQMSARLRNFLSDFGRTDILTEKSDVLAMREMKVTPTLQKLINDSKVWLKNAIDGCAEN